MSHAPTKSKSALVTILLIVILGLISTMLPAAEPGTTTKLISEYAESYPHYGVSESVRAGDFIFIGGIIATDRSGAVIAPNDGAAQAKVVYDRIKIILEAHGASFRNVVSETIYLTDWDRYLAGAEIRKKYFYDDGAEFASAVGQEVVSLVLPGLVIEVQMVAYVGENKLVGE